MYHVIHKDQNTTFPASNDCIFNSRLPFFYIYLRNYNTWYIYILLHFLIIIQLYNTTGMGPQEANDYDSPVDINVKTCK